MLLNLNRNYTGFPILGHPRTLDPRIRLYFALQGFLVEGEEARVVGHGGPRVRFGVHSGAFDLDAGHREAQVGDDDDGEGSSGGDGRRDEEGA